MSATKHFSLKILFLSILFHSSVSFVNYPEECEAFHVANDSIGVSLTCVLKDISFYNHFSFIPSENTLEISFICIDQFFSTSHTASGMFSHLTELQQLYIHNCSLQNVSEGMLQGLHSLTLLHIQYEHSYDRLNPSYSLQLPEGFFNDTPSMKHVLLPHNNITHLPSDLFCPLKQLTVLELSYNLLSSIEGLFECASDLHELYLNNNRIRTISNTSFSKIKNLVILQISNNHIVNVDGTAFTDLHSLLQLHLSWNSISVLPQELLHNNSLLIDVKLEGNYLQSIPKNFFSNNNNLELLDLSQNKLRLNCTEMNDLLYDVRSVKQLQLWKNHLRCFDFGDVINRTRKESTINPLLLLSVAGNSLKSINGSTFESLNSLAILNISFCDVERIDLQTFIHHPNLEVVLVNNNKLTEIPNFKSNLFLRGVDLSANRITAIKPLTFDHKQMVELSLSNNQIETIPKEAFSLPSLTSLYLQYNKIQHIDSNSFAKFTSLRNLHLDFNQLKFLNDTFGNISSLENLTLANNLLETFGFDHFPFSLKFLDVSKNQLRYFWTPYDESKFSLQELKAENNFLVHLKSVYFPASLRKIFLKKNRISVIQYKTFFHLPNLTWVDLSENRLTDVVLTSNFLIVHPSVPKSSYPIFALNIKYSMLNCTCDLYLLLRFNNQTVVYEPPIIDVRLLFCKRTNPWTKDTEIFFLTHLHQDSELWCLYTNSSCIFATGSPSVCPDKCSCFRTFGCHVLIQCDNTSKHIFPQNLPRSLIRINLNDNNITSLPPLSKSIPYIQIIYLKGNQIQSLKGQPFSGLTELRELILDHNLITELTGNEFVNLSSLQFLRLDHNKISFINPETFSTLISLRNLTLNNNRLYEFQPKASLNSDGEFLIFPPKSVVKSVALYRNPWSCRCDFVQFFRKWLLRYGNLIKDINNTYCYPENNTVIETNPIPIIDFDEAYCYVSEALNFVDLTLPLSLTIAMITTISLTILLVFKFRKELQVWLYSRYGIRLFHYKNKADEGKLFHAFISYSSHDEDFVARTLVPGLEVNHQPPYRLCIHERDFIVGGYIQNSIVEAVEKSCRTVLVLSKNFIRSEWCRLEFKSAHHQALQDKCCRLIIIVLEDVPEDELDIELKLYLKTNTYLKWGDRFFWDKLYFALPEIKQDIVPNRMIRPPASNGQTRM